MVLVILSFVFAVDTPPRRQVKSDQTRARKAGAQQARSIQVRAGESLQKALDAAQPGETIYLEAGATFRGPFTLPFKPSRDESTDQWITIRTLASDSLLPGANERISPSFSHLLPKLVSPGNNQPVIQTAPRAHHYRLIGLEIMPVNAEVFVRELMRLGDGSSSQNSLDVVPHDIQIDRCYIHAHPQQAVIRGIALNSAQTEVINSYISDFKSPDFDSQAIWGWNGPGPFRIVNNYLEAAGENAGFGGAVPGIANLVPSDIEFSLNHCAKRREWRSARWLVKNLFEVKSVRRLFIKDNLFENNWAQGQSGYAILFTVRGDSGHWATIEDVKFEGNVIRHAGSGVQLVGKDTYDPSGQGQRVILKNNLFYDVGQAWGGEGHFLLITNFPEVTIDHNTVMHTGNITTAYGPPSRRFVFTNNVLAHNLYGVFGGGQSPGLSTISTYFPGSTFRGNAIVGADSKDYPVGNFFPRTMQASGFINFASGDYRLSTTSRLRGRATDQKDIGCDVAELQHTLQSIDR